VRGREETKIITVTGEITPAELGFCQSHEHLFIAPGPAAERDPSLRIDDPDLTAVDVCAYKAVGGSALVDAQPVFTGRNAEVLRALSERCDVKVIASTGFHKLFYYDEESLLSGEEEAYALLYESEITEGMLSAPTFIPKGQRQEIETQKAEKNCEADEIWLSRGSAFRTDIKAGFLKTALEPVFTETHRKLFSAAAHASLATGAAVMIHVDAGADPQMLLDYLTARGVHPERLIFCHLDRMIGDIEVHKALAARSAWIEYDTIARAKYHSDDEEIRLVLEMLHAGYGKRLLMSLDVTRSRLKGYGGTPGLDYIKKNFIPRLLENGVGEAQIREIFVRNPSIAFAVPL